MYTSCTYMIIIIKPIQKQYPCMSRGPNSPTVTCRALLRRPARKGLTWDPTRTCMQFVTHSLAEPNTLQSEMTAGHDLHGFVEPSKAHTGYTSAYVPLQTYLQEFYSKFTQTICVTAQVTMLVHHHPLHQWLNTTTASLFSAIFCYSSLHYKPLIWKQKSMQGNFSWKAELNILGNKL